MGYLTHVRAPRLQSYLLHWLCLNRSTQAPLTYWPTFAVSSLHKIPSRGLGMSSPNCHNPVIFREPHTFPLVAWRLSGPLCRESFSSSHNPPPVRVRGGGGGGLYLSSVISPTGRLQCSETLQSCLGESLRPIAEAHISTGSLSLGDTLQNQLGPRFACNLQVLLPRRLS